MTLGEMVQMVPDELRLHDDRSVLSVAWPDGSCTRLEAAWLRKNSRAAQAVRDGLEGIEQPAADIRVSAIEPIGNYAIRLAFSDGHDRGIYPWAYLRALGQNVA